MRSSNEHPATLVLDVQRRCLVCDLVQDATEPGDTDAIGPECVRCHAPTERIAVTAQRKVTRERNPHAAALGRLGGLKGGPARAAALPARRRREIARLAAKARWERD